MLLSSIGISCLWQFRIWKAQFCYSTYYATLLFDALEEAGQEDHTGKETVTSSAVDRGPSH